MTVSGYYRCAVTVSGYYIGTLSSWVQGLLLAVVVWNRVASLNHSK